MTREQLVESVAYAVGDMREEMRAVIRAHIPGVLKEIGNKIPRFLSFEQTGTYTSDSARDNFELDEDVGEILTVYTVNGDIDYITVTEFKELYPDSTAIASGSPNRYTVWNRTVYLNGSTASDIEVWYYIKPNYDEYEVDEFDDIEVLFWGLLEKVSRLGSEPWFAAVRKYRKTVVEMRNVLKSSQQFSKIRPSDQVRNVYNKRGRQRGQGRV